MLKHNEEFITVVATQSAAHERALDWTGNWKSPAQDDVLKHGHEGAIKAMIQ